MGAGNISDNPYFRCLVRMRGKDKWLRGSGRWEMIIENERRMEANYLGGWRSAKRMTKTTEWEIKSEIFTYTYATIFTHVRSCVTRVAVISAGGRSRTVKELQPHRAGAIKHASVEWKGKQGWKVKKRKINYKYSCQYDDGFIEVISLFLRWNIFHCISMTLFLCFLM